MLRDDTIRRAVGQYCSAGCEHDDAIHKITPDRNPMLDHHERRTGVCDDRSDRRANFTNAVQIEIGGRFIKQQQPRLHRKNACQCQSLFLPSGERSGRVVEGEIESDRLERAPNPKPYLRSWYPEVLTAERNVVTDAGKDHLCVRVLQHEADSTARALRYPTINEEFTIDFAVIITTEDPGKRMQQCRLAGSGCTKQQHALPGQHCQVDATQRPV